tara:strand:- start:483 stop:956 length:474 start_codon:yes stop_codon:yes gene_type:complete
MKTRILILLLLLISSTAISQTILTALTSPGSWDDGPSAGVGIENQEGLLYYGAEAYAFPQLNGIDYAHAIGRIGLNIKLDHWGRFKIIGGVRVGLIYRGEHLNYALIGAETGIQVEIFDNLYGIITASRDSRSDSKYYSSQDSITVNSVWVKIGIKL